MPSVKKSWIVTSPSAWVDTAFTYHQLVLFPVPLWGSQALISSTAGCFLIPLCVQGKPCVLSVLSCRPVPLPERHRQPAAVPQQSHPLLQLHHALPVCRGQHRSYPGADHKVRGTAFNLPTFSFLLSLLLYFGSLSSNCSYFWISGFSWNDWL